MTPATRYQALPIAFDEAGRQSLAVNAVYSENDPTLSASASAISSEHEPSLWGTKAKSPENQAFLSPSHFLSKKVPSPEGTLVNGKDITSDLSFDEGTRTRDIPTQLPENIVRNFDTSTYTWLPYTLRQPFLFALFALSIALALVTILLSWISSRRNGLGDDNRTSILLFGWRSSPTLVIVLFVILETLLLNDARRTEVFARLSNHSASANAPSTLLAGRFHWWNDPLEAVSLKRNGGLRSQVLLYAAIMNVIGSFVLSPLSAAFLSVEPTQMSQHAVFVTLPSLSNATTAVSPDDETYFKSISALVVNLTTSVWLTKDYAIVPFWPADLSKAPLGATVPVIAQNWTANTTIFQAELNCIPMSVENLQTDSFQLVSEDGCSLAVVVAVPENSSPSIPSYAAGNNAGPTEDDAQEDTEFFFPILNSGSFWLSASVDSDDFSSILNNDGVNVRNQTMITNVSTACEGRYILAVNTPFNISFTLPKNISLPITASDISSNLSSFSINSHLCSTRFVMANLTATISISSSNTSISFDQTAFNQSKVELQAGKFNVSSFESAFYSDNWTKRLNTSYYGTWMGPAAVLGAQYDYDAEAMMNDPLLLSKAQQVKQRFFGEGLITAFSKVAEQGSTLMGGEVARTRNRIVASFGIGITIGTLLLCTSMMVLLVFYFSRLSRRPLNLDRDPGSAAAVSSLLKHEGTRSHFQGLERLPEPLIDRRLGDLHFELQPQGLLAHHANISQG